MLKLSTHTYPKANESSISVPIVRSMEIIPEAFSLLLIDDDRDQLDHFAWLLRGDGFRIHTAISPSIGLELLKKYYIDMLICDLRMPDKTGFELVEEIRSLRPFPGSTELQIIILSSCSNDLELAALGVGADAYCQKSDAELRLSSLVRELLAEREDVLEEELRIR